MGFFFLVHAALRMETLVHVGRRSMSVRNKSLFSWTCCDSNIELSPCQSLDIVGRGKDPGVEIGAIIPRSCCHTPVRTVGKSACRPCCD